MLTKNDKRCAVAGLVVVLASVALGLNWAWTVGACLGAGIAMGVRS